MGCECQYGAEGMLWRFVFAKVHEHISLFLSLDLEQIWNTVFLL